MKRSFDELCELWIEAGGPAGWAPLMAGIALAESGGTATAVQPDQPPATTGWGLWQITPGTPGLLTPKANARAAAAKFEAAAKEENTGLLPWFDDRTWTAWQAAGAPDEPTTAQVRLYLAQWGYTMSTPAPRAPGGEEDQVIIIRTATKGAAYLVVGGRLVGLDAETQVAALQGAGVGVAEFKTATDFTRVRSEIAALAGTPA